MGKQSDLMSVVDADCHVHGIENLRVIDASVFPTLPNGNINAPVIMVAEKVADVILGNPALPAANIELELPEQWETKQRTGVPLRVS